VRLYATGVRAFLSWCDRQGRPATLDRLTVAAFVAELLNDGREAATARAPVAQFHARPATALQRNGRRLVAADTHSDARP
jgi:hypothetical protein